MAIPNAGREPRTWGYGRASTKKQEASPETQKEIIKDYAKYHDLPGDVTFFIDKATSGKVPWEDRTAGKEIFKFLRPGDHVVISKLDRAFRSLVDCVVILRKLQAMGINLHIVNLMGGAVDLSSPMGKFIVHILVAVAELEREYISERTKDGMLYRKKAKFQYCHHPGYGFKWSGHKIKNKETGQWFRQKVSDPEERHVMQAIVTWRMSGTPWPDIARHLAEQGILTKDGTPWSEIRVRRACKAELKLQLQEGRAKPA